MNAIFKAQSRLWGADEKIEQLRIKYWKGRPTKRYRKLLGEMDKNAWYTDLDFRSLLTE